MDLHLPYFKVEEVGELNALSDHIGWGLRDLQVPMSWMETKGEGVVVMVIDSGVANHPDIGDNELKNYSKSFVDEGFQDYVGHGCILPADKIYTSIYGLQKIEDAFNSVNGNIYFIDDAIVKDVSYDNFFTLSMNKIGHTEPKKINAIHKLKYFGSIYNVKTKEGNLGLTPWHLVYVLSSRRGLKKTIKKVRADELKIGDRILTSGISDCFINYNEIFNEDSNNKIILNEDLAYIMGLICSDGHLIKKKTQYRLSFHNTNYELGTNFKNLINKIFNIEVKFRERIIEGNKPCGEWYFDNKFVFKFFEKLGIPRGCKSTSLKLPVCITNSPHSVIFSFYSGYIDGDGSICKKSGRIRIISSSKDFVEESKLLLRTLGIRASSFNHVYLKEKKCKIKNKSCCYCLRISSDIRLTNSLRIKRNNKYSKGQSRVSSKIISIDKSHYDGYLYDLTVEDNNNYVANGLIVSNTHVSGIISAKNNAIGIVGVAPLAKIISVKVIDKYGRATDRVLKRALEYAESIKPDIINLSLGSYSKQTSLERVYKRLIYDLNIPIVCASGNSGKKGVMYPAKYPFTISVGSYKQGRGISEFSSYCEKLEHVDFVAPGEEILSTHLNGKYAVMSGTSMAAPFMSGIIALLISKYKKNNQSYTVEEIRNLLAASSINLGEKKKDSMFGYGIINIERALREIEGYNLASIEPKEKSWIDKLKEKIKWK